MPNLEYPLEIVQFSIAIVEEEGFLLKFELNKLNEFDLENEEIKLFIPCYNEQSGYYSSNLTLNIFILGEDEEEINIGDAVPAP